MVQFISAPDDLLFSTALSKYCKVQALTAESAKNIAKAALPLPIKSNSSSVNHAGLEENTNLDRVAEKVEAVLGLSLSWDFSILRINI